LGSLSPLQLQKMAEQKESEWPIFDELGFSQRDHKKFSKILKYVEDLDLEDLKCFSHDDLYEAEKTTISYS
jgi:hypothetical protein